MNFKRSLLPIFVTLLSFAHIGKAELPLSLCKRGDTIYVPTVEMTKGNKKVFFLGFLHIGPHTFYLDQRYKISRWLHTHPGKTTILTEHYTCSGPVLAIKGGDLPYGQINYLLMHQQDAPSDLARDFGTNFETVGCEPSLDGKNMRPAYIAQIEKDLSEEAKQSSLDSQWGMDYPATVDTVVKSGDLVMNLERQLPQIIGSIPYRKVRIVENETRILNRLLFESFMIQYRNVHLAMQILEELKTKDQVIVPWGAAHREGIEQILGMQGFEVTQRDSTRFAMMSLLPESDIKNELLDNLKDAEQNSPLCWPDAISEPRKSDSTKNGISF